MIDQDAVQQLTLDLKEIFRRLHDLETNPFSVSGGAVPAPDAQYEHLEADAALAWDNVVNLTLPDDAYIGLPGPGGRLVFDLTPAPDQVVLTDANLNLSGNDFLVPDNTADAFKWLDDGATEYMRLVTLNAQPIIDFNAGGADVDFHVRGSGGGLADALQVQASDGQITLGGLGAGFVQSSAGGVLSSAAILAAQLPAHTHADATQGGATLSATLHNAAATVSAIFTHSANLVLDDGADDSPSFILIGGSNDQASIFLDDDGTPGDSDLVIRLPGADDDAQLQIQSSAPATVAYIDAAGNADFSAHVAIGGAASVNTAIVGNIAETFTWGAGAGFEEYSGIWSNLTINTTAAGYTNKFAMGALVRVTLSPDHNVGAPAFSSAAFGLNAQVVVADGKGADVGELVGGRWLVDVEDASALSGTGLNMFTPFVDTGSCVTGRGLWINQGTVGAGSITTLYGMFISSINAGGTNWAIYTNDGNVRFGDRVAIEAATPLAQLHVDQPDGGGNIPVLKLDQGDVSEPCVLYSVSGADADIVLWELEVTGTPWEIWDESGDNFNRNKALIIDPSEAAVEADVPLHVHLSSAGVVAASTKSNLAVFESFGESGEALINGIGILVSDGGTSHFIFGNESDNDRAGLSYSHGSDTLTFTIAGADDFTMTANAFNVLAGSYISETGIRATLANAEGLYVPWIIGDADSTSYFGSTNANNDQAAIEAYSDSATTIFAHSEDAHGIFGQTNAAGATVNGVWGNAQAGGRGVYGSSISGEGVTGASATGIALRANLTGAGAAILQCEDNGTPVFFVGDGGPLVGINETSNANMTIGLTIDQAANDDEIANFRSSDVGATWSGVETGSYLTVDKANDAAGGARIRGFRDADGTPREALSLRGYLAEAPATAKTVGGALAIVEIQGYQTDGTDIVDTIANGNVLAVRTRNSGSVITLMVIDEDADMNLINGRIATGFGDYWDIEDYHAGAPTADGFVRVDINGVTVELLANLA